jgi:hypothetical protein
LVAQLPPNGSMIFNKAIFSNWVAPDPVASVAMRCKHLESSDQPLAFGHRSVKEHIRDFAGQWPH